MGTLKKIGVGIAIIVIAGVIMLFINAAYNEYADVGYQLQGAPSLDLNYIHSLQVELREKNDGNLAVIPISKIHVLNATIIQVSIPKVAQYELPQYCNFNETTATVSNLTIPKGYALSVWATIQVMPKEGVTSFAIYANVELPPDWMHPRNRATMILPTELVYNRTSTNVYSLLQV